MSNFKILAVVAHPADSATEASGTLALHAERGDHVTSVVTTFGDRHHMQWLYDEIKKPESERDPDLATMDIEVYRNFKKREAERIAEIIGVHELIFTGWTDHEVAFSWEKVEDITKIILRVKPDIVITHFPYRLSGGEDDHIVVGRIVMSAISRAWAKVPQFDGVEPYRGVKQVFFSFAGHEEVNSRNIFTNGVVCDVWIDTTSVIHKKVQAMDQLVSQGYQGTAARKIAEARDGRWGMIAGCAYAEPFARPTGITYDSLPMPERVLKERYTPNNLPNDALIASSVPSGTPPDAYRLRSQK
ncbi:MAG: PIG-L family deacetylase [Chloroflexi bacterium]|nr:PIG-L family deacetylase [Chloroflexota bacterium]